MITTVAADRACGGGLPSAFAASIGAAVEPGCHPVYSEDLSDGQSCAGVRVVNPFA